MKSMNTMVGALLGGAMMLGALALPATGLAADKGKLVVQVSDSNPATWNLALNNVKNVQKDLGKDNVEVEIVAYGPGIGMLKADSEVANRINEATESGVKVVACENTMKGQKLTRDDMNAKISYVPAGVVEIMQLQQKGYAYLRP
jgi:intracellular sulfur oxidation DsrE/DsrF family protein